MPMEEMVRQVKNDADAELSRTAEEHPSKSLPQIKF
jgi:hypothetical protein